MRRALVTAIISALVSFGLPASQSFAATHACSGGGSITVAGTRVTSQSGCTGVVRVPDGVTETCAQASEQVHNRFRHWNKFGKSKHSMVREKHNHKSQLADRRGVSVGRVGIEPTTKGL